MNLRVKKMVIKTAILIATVLLSNLINLLPSSGWRDVIEIGINIAIIGLLINLVNTLPKRDSEEQK